MNRLDATEKIVATKVAKGLKWAELAQQVGLSKAWVRAGCLGQMQFDDAHAAALAKIFDLAEAEAQWPKVVPSKGSLPTAVPTDPLIYRFYELVNVYGSTSRNRSTKNSATAS